MKPPLAPTKTITVQAPPSIDNAWTLVAVSGGVLLLYSLSRIIALQRRVRDLEARPPVDDIVMRGMIRQQVSEMVGELEQSIRARNALAKPAVAPAVALPVPPAVVAPAVIAPPAALHAVAPAVISPAVVAPAAPPIVAAPEYIKPDPSEKQDFKKTEFETPSPASAAKPKRKTKKIALE